MNSLGRSLGLVLWGSVALSVAAWGAETELAKARDLAFNGHRAEAVKLLEDSLSKDPDDSDVLTLYGTILSWDGKYGEARAALKKVLAKNPTHGDALPALINVEMWSGNPEAAEELAARGLAAKPGDPALLIARARALRKMGRLNDAVLVVNKLVAEDPSQSAANSLREDILSDMRTWETTVNSSYEMYSDHRSGRLENVVGITRHTSIGSFALNAWQTNQYGISSKVLELDSYVTVRPGSYINLVGAYSPDAQLYSRYRAAGEWFQSLPKGLEASFGYKRLGFSSPVNVYTASVSKYWHSWLFNTRTYVTPGAAGDSHSYNFSARRYFSDGQSYLAARYGFGASPTISGSLSEIEVLGSHSYSLDANLLFARRLEWHLRAGYTREDQIYIVGLKHYLLQTSLGYKF